MAGLIFTYEGELIHQAAIYDQVDFLLNVLSIPGTGDANSRDQRGRSPVHTAAQHGSEKCLKLLLENGGNPNLVSSQTDCCSTPAHHAAYNGHFLCLKLLVEKGADLDISNANGRTPIDLAIEERHTSCARFLKDEKVRRHNLQIAGWQEEAFSATARGNFHRLKEIIEQLGNEFDVDKQYAAGETLLLKACEKGNVDAVDLLLASGASGTCNPYSGISPLYAACVNQNVVVVKKLLRRFPNLAKHGTKVENNNPLHFVSGCGNVEIAKLLLQTDDGSEPYPCLGIDINCETSSGMTPLHNAAIAGHIEIINLLFNPNHHCCTPCSMKSNVNVNAKSKVGRTPLHDAVTLGNVDIVEVLLEHKANPNCAVRTDDMVGYLDVSELMADMLDVNIGATMTALQLACSHKKTEIMKMLLHHGAQDFGNKCLHYATTNDNEEMTIILLRKDVHPSHEYSLPLKLREQHSDWAPISIVWHNYDLHKIEAAWLYSAPKAILRPAVSATMNNLMLASLITNLDLSNNRLQSLPIEIFQLSSLRHLNVSHNELSMLPVGKSRNDAESSSADDVFVENRTEIAVWYCPHLEEIELQYNNLTTLPGCLFLLPALRIVDANNNDLNGLPYDIWHSPNLRIAIFSNNYIDNVPVLPNSSDVVSGSNWSSPRFNGNTSYERQSSSTSSSDRRANEDRRNEKPQERRLRIISYRTLLGDANPEADDSDEEELDTQVECVIEKLDLSYNQLTKFPIGLTCLAPKLSKLLLSNNGIDEFPPIQEIPELLSHLDLSFNKIKTCVPSYDDNQCDRLCYSPVRKRRSTRRTRSRTSTSSTMRTWCRHCRHRQLRHLKRLELNNNLLWRIHFVYNTPNADSDICVYPNLMSLTLSRNKLEYLTEELGKLVKLGSLDVSYNPLTRVPRLPPAIGLLGDLWDLNVKGLNLYDPPPNVLEKRTKAITGYLLSILDEAQPYPSLKLMFVGVSNIGKTTLLGKLKGDTNTTKGWHERKVLQKTPQKGKKSENVSTVGVDVAEWVCPNPAGTVLSRNSRPSVIFSTWDFGGQKEYYATHQLFLTHRALYLAIWKLTDGEDGVRKLYSWLLNIQARAPDSVVIIVGTFYDKLSAKDKKSGFVDRMHNLIRELYVGKELGGGVGIPRERGLPNVVRTIDVSCTTGHQISQLREIIYNTALEIKGHGGFTLVEEQKIPASYLAVKEAVLNIAIKCNYTNQTPVLMADDFRQKVEHELDAKHVKLRDDDELAQACQFLHDNGILLHYDDPSLSGLYFLDPQWLCDMMAHVVAIRDVNPFVQNGVMKSSDLSHIFKSDRFPSQFINEYVNLLNKFEMALPLISHHLLVPSLLPEKQIRGHHISAPGLNTVVATAMNMMTYTENRVIRRQYLMSYVPSGFWARLITRMINDKQLESAVGDCLSFTMNQQSVILEHREKSTIAQPEWSCWKTGLELSCYGVKLLRVCQLEDGVPFYGCPKDSERIQLLINGEKKDKSSCNVVEIIAPSVMLEIEKSALNKPLGRRNSGQQDSQSKNYFSFSIKSVKDSNVRTAARFLALTIHHIDNLLEDWYPGLDSINIYGESLVNRLIPCSKCLRRIITTATVTSSKPKNIPSNDHWPNSHKSVFYFNTPPNSPQIHSTPLSSKNGIISPSSGSDSSFGFENESGFAVTDSDAISRESSPASSVDNHDGNGYEQQSSDTDTDDFSTSSATSGVQSSPQHRGNFDEKLIATFSFEECVVRSQTSDHVYCLIDGKLFFREEAPDVVFADVAPELNIDTNCVDRRKKLGRGTFGTVYAAEIKLNDGSVEQVALKMPLDTAVDENASEEEKNEAKMLQRKIKEVPHLVFTEAYRTIRQELSILVNLNHPHILQLRGFCLNPLSLILEFAPKKSLDRILADYKRAGQRLDPFVLQKCVVQCSAALKYLHRRHIIYRDLKSENILVWEFPEPFTPNQSAHSVLIKLADYGISRSASMAGAKGLGGTLGFMAPEIEKYSGRESYTDKVDSFSFGMFMYELITLNQPFSDLNQAQIKQMVVEGKQPLLTSKDKRAPVFALELMLWCWSQNPEKRPSSNEIYSISTCSEFPRLLEVLTFNEATSLTKPITTRSRDYAGQGADGQLSVGKEVWLFHSKFIKGVTKDIVDVLSFSNGRSDHMEEFVLDKYTIRVACSVGNTVWLGTKSGVILVYCAITYKLLCQGALSSDKLIMAMIHAPKCNCVFVSFYHGQIMAYSDNVYSKFRESCDIPSPKDLTPLRVYVGDNFAHSLAIIGVPKDNHGTEGPVAIEYEVWLGRVKGRILILDAETLKEKQEIAAEDCELDNPILDNLAVTSLQTCQTFSGNIDEFDPLATSVWIAVYPGTCVYRYDARAKCLLNSVDCLQNHLAEEGSHSYTADQRHKVTEAQVLSLLVVNKELYIGTSSGAFLVCNSLSLLVYSVIRCHKSYLESLLPLTTTPVTWNLDTDDPAQKTYNRLVLTFGKGYRSLCAGGAWNASKLSKTLGEGCEPVILVWLADER